MLRRFAPRNDEIQRSRDANDVRVIKSFRPQRAWGMVLTVSFVLSPVTGLFCHRRLQDHRLANLISASGYQDHTTSPSAWLISSASPKRPSHPAPTFRDDREAPLLVGHGMARTSKGDLPDGESENFFDEGMDKGGRGAGVICPSGKSRVSRFRSSYQLAVPLAHDGLNLEIALCPFCARNQHVRRFVPKLRAGLHGLFARRVKWAFAASTIAIIDVICRPLWLYRCRQPKRRSPRHRHIDPARPWCKVDRFP